MPRYLSIDWDRRQLHVVAADVQRGRVAAEQTLTWELSEELSSNNAESLGARFRDFLRDRRIPPAPVIACVGRSQVVVKELRFPAVRPEEEPQLVRFQAMRELGESADTVLDYTVSDAEPGQRFALAVAYRKSQLALFQQFCKAAGLKLHAFSLRTQGVAAALQNPGLPSTPLAVLLVSSSTTEFLVVQQGTLLFSRTIHSGPNLSAELRRTVAALGFQDQARQAQSLVILGTMEATEQAALDKAAGLPLVSDIPPNLPPPPFLGPQGLLEEIRTQGRVSLNFLAPREPRPVVNTSRERYVVVGGLAFLVLLGVLFLGQQTLSNKQGQIAALNTHLENLKRDLKQPAQEKVEIDTLAEWDHTTVSWLDEIYDLSARFPMVEGFRIKQIQINPLMRKAADKTGKAALKPGDPKRPTAGPGKVVEHVASLKIIGVLPRESDPNFYRLIDQLQRDPHLKTVVDKAAKEFTVTIEVASRPGKEFTTVLVPAARPPAPPPPSSSEDVTEGDDQ